VPLDGRHTGCSRFAAVPKPSEVAPSRRAPAHKPLHTTPCTQRAVTFHSEHSITPTAMSELTTNTVKVRLTLGQPMKTQRDSRGIALLFI
jgi:hypothetical protein